MSFVSTTSLSFILFILACMYSILLYFVNTVSQNKLKENKMLVIALEAKLVVLKSIFMDLPSVIPV